MKSISIILFLFIVASLTSCGGSSSITEQAPTEQQNPIAKPDEPETELRNFSKEDVARFAMSSIMGQPSRKIKVQHENDLYYVSYVRKSDSQEFNYKITIPS